MTAAIASIITLFAADDNYFGNFGLFGPIIYSFAMYLMMEHNQNVYLRFLKYLYWSKLYYFCGCYKSIIEKQLESTEDGHDGTNNVETGQEEESTINTNLSVKVDKIEQQGVDLSVLSD